MTIIAPIADAAMIMGFLFILLGYKSSNGSRVVQMLKCSCGWIKKQEPSDPKGAMLWILKGIHEMTFTGHVCKIEEE